MGFLTTRISAVSNYLVERVRRGVPLCLGSPDREVLVILDGVGGFQFAPLLVRRALREEGSSLATIVVAWQCCLPGEIWTDLCWYRRNRVMGVHLARKLLAHRRAHPGTIIHILAFSGGAGIAVFACEALAGRKIIESLILPCPALSPDYNLGPALAAVERCYALVSSRDKWILGLGTRLFGTTDRRFVDAAGLVGFRPAEGISDRDRRAYQRLREIRWTPSLKKDGHQGGHTAWAAVGFLRKHLLPIIRGEPLLPARKVIAG